MSTNLLPVMDFVEAVAEYTYRRFVEEVHTLDTGEANSSGILPSVSWSTNLVEDCDTVATMLARAFRNPGNITSSWMTAMF
jgi:hypothetical protein